MIVRKTQAEIEAMARAGEIHVKTMNLLAGKVRPGVTTGELDAAAEKFIRSQGATPAFKGYRGFPGSICASPNHMVVHGIPGRFKLRKGDILSIDIGVVKDGWVADGARTFATLNIGGSTTTTVSFGGTICTSCGLLSKSARLNVAGVRLLQASDRCWVARSVMRCTSRCSICVSGRCGMNRSALDPPSNRSMIG